MLTRDDNELSINRFPRHVFELFASDIFPRKFVWKISFVDLLSILKYLILSIVYGQISAKGIDARMFGVRINHGIGTFCYAYMCIIVVSYGND